MIERGADVGLVARGLWARSMPLACPSVALRWLVACLLMMPVVASAAEAPPQLLGKTTVMSWNEFRVQRCDDGETKRGHTSSSLQVYVSEKGRLFTKLSRRGGRGGSNSNDVDPEGGNQRAGTGAAGNMNASFEGSSLVVQNAMRSGARRIQATFDAAFAACSVQVRFGKEGGGELRHRTMDGKMCNIISTDVSGTACSIRTGNLVGG